MSRTLVRSLPIAFLVLPALAPAAPLRVVMDQNHPPCSCRDQDGMRELCTVGLRRPWGKMTGTPVTPMPANRAHVLPMPEQGAADAIDPIFLTPLRVPCLDFPDGASRRLFPIDPVTGLRP